MLYLILSFSLWGYKIKKCILFSESSVVKSMWSGAGYRCYVATMN